MSLLSLLAAGCCLVGTSISAAISLGNEGSGVPTVSVKNGTYSGIYSQTYDQDFFLGMRYAQQPVRFTQPQPLNETWDGTKEATAYPPHCVGYGGDDIGYEISEDCLYLNVIRPAGLSDTAGLPVAVWIHGGGLYMGGSADRRYNMSFIVENSIKLGTPVVAVSLNYRLSAFGFLSGKEAEEAGLGNIGFLDQRMALRWVNENIAAFGGSPDKVTIFGESSGAESVSAQVLAYNGRDDGLFRAAVGQSGFGSILHRYAGGLNASAARQQTFRNLVANVSSCASLVDADAIPCLRTAPLAELHHALNDSSVGPWGPVLDGDFIADFPANQLSSGRFPKIPILVGTNTDEGASFGRGKGPGGEGVNTDAEFVAAVRATLGPDAAAAENDALVSAAAYLYPDIQSVGIPSLDTWPEIVGEDTADIASLGLQYRRTNAFFGDYSFHYFRRRSNIAWAKAGLPSYSYRFDVTVNGAPPETGSTHFQEVAFVFHNLDGLGYETNPFENKPQSFKDLSLDMNTAWINFFVSGDPNGATVSPTWPAYSLEAGGGVGQGVVFSAGDSHVEYDDWRAAGINWMMDVSLNVFGL